MHGLEELEGVWLQRALHQAGASQSCHQEHVARLQRVPVRSQQQRQLGAEQAEASPLVCAAERKPVALGAALAQWRSGSLILPLLLQLPSRELAGLSEANHKLLQLRLPQP